jgi:uncharacterized lipoprotein YmbA
MTGRYLMLMLVLLLAGCADIGRGTREPTRSWLLLPVEAPLAAQAEGPSLGVGPVEVAPYLDRMAIVRRGDGQRLDLAAFDQWAEPLPDGIQRVLVENLARLAPVGEVRFHPWRHDVAPDLQLRLRVLRFDAATGGEAELRVAWELREPGGRSLLRRQSSHRAAVPAGKTGTADLVAALNQTLTDFSQEVAAAVAALPGK